MPGFESAAAPPLKERHVFGLTMLSSSHPEVRRLQHAAARPSLHGQKVWPTSFVLLLDYLQQRGVSPQARVLELGCGWGLVGIACAKTFQAQVTGLDADAAVFPYLQSAPSGMGCTSPPGRAPLRTSCPRNSPRSISSWGRTSAFRRNSWTPCSSWCVTASPWVSQKSWWRILVVPPLTSSVRCVCSRATRRCWPGRRPCPSGKEAGFSGWSAMRSPCGGPCGAAEVEQPTAVRAAVSLTTVHALGPAIPPILRMLADEVMWWARQNGSRPDARAVGNLEAYNECTHACRSDIPPNSVTRVARKEYNSETVPATRVARG